MTSKTAMPNENNNIQSAGSGETEFLTCDESPGGVSPHGISKKVKSQKLSYTFLVTKKMCSHNRQPESPPSEEITDELALSLATKKEGLGQALSQNNSDDVRYTALINIRECC